MTNTQTALTASEHQRRFLDWKAYAQDVRMRADSLQQRLHERGWALAASVGIPRCGCSLHNASIDDGLTGWCKGNPERLKVAKAAKHILDDWSISAIGDRLIKRAWNQMVAVPNDWAQYDDVA